jgi:lycopene beta-cyclase
MTYWQFLVIFLLPPLLVLAVIVRTSITRSLILTVVGISAVAIGYTGPWDSEIIQHGVWSYGSRQVVGILIGHVPLEEYCFYVLQVSLATLVTVLVGRLVGETR